MKKLIFLSLISISIFSCNKKKEDLPQPAPDVVKPITIDTSKNKANNKIYIYENDTALSFIEKWQNKTIKCVNVDKNYSQDTILITITKIISSGFSFEYEGNYILRVNWKNQFGSQHTIDYLAFKNNRFIQKMNELNTHRNPWIIDPISSYLDFEILPNNKLWFSLPFISTTTKGFNVLN